MEALFWPLSSYGAVSKVPSLSDVHTFTCGRADPSSGNKPGVLDALHDVTTQSSQQQRKEEALRLSPFCRWGNGDARAGQEPCPRSFG